MNQENIWGSSLGMHGIIREPLSVILWHPMMPKDKGIIGCQMPKQD